eukprot:s157_g42.t1
MSSELSPPKLGLPQVTQIHHSAHIAANAVVEQSYGGFSRHNADGFFFISMSTLKASRMNFRYPFPTMGLVLSGGTRRGEIPCNPWPKPGAKGRIILSCRSSTRHSNEILSFCHSSNALRQVPYACAAARCVNEDFPCNWARGCGIPKGMLRTSLACLRSCNDHNEMLSSIGYDQTCSEIIGRFGCQSDSLAINIPEFCPVSCKSPECAYRCDRSWQEGGEVPNLQQQRCWTQIEGGLPCLDAIKFGQDCHCKCASEYVRMGSIRGRKPGALSVSDQLDGKDLSLNLEAIVGRTITLDFTGERMRSEEPAHAQGPRLKIIPDDQICGTAALAFNITGLSCEQPPGADALGGYICTTPPTLATPFLHRWGGIQMNACGRFLLCHCNELCDIKSNWVRAGYLEIKPQLTFGSMSAPLPGCAAYLPTLPPKQVDTGNGEILQKTLITSYISIDGGLRPLPETLMAVAKSFASYTSVRSELLDADAPSEADVEVTDYDRVDFGDRRLQACVDDDAAFQAEAAKASLTSVTSCSEALTFLGSKDQLCNDQTLENAAGGP